MSAQFLPSAPAPGEIVRVRQRQYLVEEVQPPPEPGDATLVSMSCLDDDAQGEALEVLWEHEIDTEVVLASWDRIGRRDFDAPSRFAAYLHALRWNCVTATNPRLFQSPWRAGIEVMSYQLEPLRKALRLPRVNLFIADDVGLGKTIEAGLVLRQMLMRQRVRRAVVVAPPSVVIQWREELEQRFGLTFVIYDRDYVARCRRERGYAVNPWTTHSRFILSHALLRDEEYAAPLRDLLSIDENGKPRDGADPGSLLILDEAHHAAPASSSKYAIDSQFTRAVRDLAERFEHRLFLSATPHNGLSNSFSALLEILDPQRFVRGTPVEPKLRDEVMVRRLKADLREVSGGFPVRKIMKVDLQGLPADAPELALARLLDEYWEAREERLEGLPPKERAAQGLVLVNLQKRLFSSVEAFHRTLKAHRRALERAAAEPLAALTAANLELLLAQPDAEDVHSELPEDEVETEEEQVVEAVTAASGRKPSPREVDLVTRMDELAERSRRLPDARVRWLIDWVREEMCPKLPALGVPSVGAPAEWLPRRVVLFTEYADTKRYLEQQLKAAIGTTDQGDDRLATFHGGMPDDLREQVKRAFNADPAMHPLRILVATDAAREGVNLQNHCADLFHMDLPWNPSRLEQRNGRIDRKLQRAAEVRCHYFVYAQREADRVLEVLAERTRVVHEELGSMPPVLEERMTRRLARGIGPRGRKELADALRRDTAEPTGQGAPEELEGARERKAALQAQLDELRNREILSKNPACAARILPYLGGSELNDDPTHAFHRHAIFLSDIREEEELSQWPELHTIVREKVKPERDALGDSPAFRPIKRRWWTYLSPRTGFYAAIKGMERILAISEVSKHWAVTFLPTGMIYSHKLVLFRFSKAAEFALLQSRVHESWARFVSSSRGDGLNYAVSDCFATFPFPASRAGLDIELVGERYFDFRAALMAHNDEGLTKTYNRFHDPDEIDAAILKLRELHAAMDRAVLDAYGWTDIQPACEFLLDYEEEDDDTETSGGRRKKKPWRYRWPDEIRDEVLARLLELNAQRAKEEAGTPPPRPEVPTPAAKKPRGRGKAKKPTPPGQGELFGKESE